MCRGLGSVCYIWSISPVLSGVLCEFKYALSNSFFLSFFLFLSLSLSEDLSPRTMPQDYQAWWLLAVPSPPGRAAAPVSTVLPAAMETWPVHRKCYLSQTCCFQLSRDSRICRDTLNDRLWKANWHLLLRCWPVAPSTTTVIINIWPCWSSMNFWTSWPCTVIILTWHSQKRIGHPSEPGSSLGFFLGSFS